MHNTVIAQKLGELKSRLAAMPNAAVAFSGGVDSTLVLKLAVDILGPSRVLALTAVSPSHPEHERRLAVELADSLAVQHRLVPTAEFDDPRFVANTPQRCYICKTHILAALQDVACSEGFLTVLDGGNADDKNDWRPGMRAVAEAGVLSPLADFGFTKQEVRQLCKHFDLPNHDKPAAPCLATRIPFGQPITREKLIAVDEAERFIKQTFVLADCRVRHFDHLARIEVPLAHVATVAGADAMRLLQPFFKQLGFDKIEVDPRGLRSGSLSEQIDQDLQS